MSNNLITTPASSIIDCLEMISSVNKSQLLQSIRLSYQNLWYQLSLISFSLIQYSSSCLDIIDLLTDWLPLISCLHISSQLSDISLTAVCIIFTVKLTSSFSFSSCQASLASAEDSTFTLTHQIQDFFDFEHLWAQEITASHKQTITQFLWITVQSGQSHTSDCQTHSKSKEVSNWSQEWVTDLLKLKQNINCTVQVIQASVESENSDLITISESTQTDSSSYTQFSNFCWTSSQPSLFTMSGNNQEKEHQQPQSNCDFINEQWAELTDLIAQAVTAVMIVQ